MTVPDTLFTVGETRGRTLVRERPAAEIVPRFGIVDPLLEQLTIARADALM